MSEKIVKNVSDIIVHMTETVVHGKRPNTENATEKKILSKLARELSWGMLLETADWSNLKAVRIAVNEQGYMDITMITHDQWMSDGYARPATTIGTPSMVRG